MSRIGIHPIRWGLLVFTLLLPSTAFAQPAPSGLTGGYWTSGSDCNAVTFSGPTGPRTMMVDSHGNLCISGSISATTSGFAPNGTPSAPAHISVTQVTAAATLPAASPDIAVSNIGSNVVYVAFGASATTNDQPIQPGGTPCFHVPAGATQMSAIADTGKTSTVAIQGGTGLCSGMGGGGAGGGGAVTVASGADVAEGAIGDAAWGGSGNATLIALGKATVGALAAVMPGNALGSGSSGLNSTMGVGSASGDPCSFLTHTFAPIAISTATNTKIATGVSAQKIRICHMFLFTEAANSVAVVEGTGGTCTGSPAGVIGGATAATGLVFAANQGFVMGNGNFAIAQAATAADDVCLITSAATHLSGVISYVSAP